MSPDIAWSKLIHDDSGGGPTAVRPPLIADRCDLLERSGRVDPLPFVDDEARKTLSSGAELFGDGNLKHVRAAPIRRDDRCEYAWLVARQLRSRKVCFHQDVLCSASIFPVGKSNGALREMWNGHDLSVIAASPQRPPHLAGVTALLDLEATSARPIRIFKRDARCSFDQLSLDPTLQPYFGRSDVTVEDMLRFTDFSLAALQRH